jgi:hypothetical protein
MRVRSAVGTVAVGVLLMSGCGGGGGDIVGNWTPSDGSGMKVIASSGACQGMYYNQGKPLDIGGGMTCSYSQNADSAGMHSLVVSQPPNQETLKLKFVDADTVEVYSGSKLLFTMKRS